MKFKQNANRQESVPLESTWRIANEVPLGAVGPTLSVREDNTTGRTSKLFYSTVAYKAGICVETNFTTQKTHLEYYHYISRTTQ